MVENWPTGVRVNFVEIFPCNIGEEGGVGKEVGNGSAYFFSSSRQFVRCPVSRYLANENFVKIRKTNRPYSRL